MYWRFVAILLLFLATSLVPARLLSEDSSIPLPLEVEKTVAKPRVKPNEFPRPTQIGMVVSLRGKGRITSADGAKRALKMGAPIYVGDRIDTGLGAYTQVTFKDRSKIALHGSSDFKVDSYAYQLNGEVQYKSSVDNGMLSFMAGQIGKIAPQNFKVETATAVVGIRGTSGEVMTADGTIPGRPKGLEVMKKGGVGVTLAPSVPDVDRTTPPLLVVEESGRGFVMDTAGNVETVTFTKSPSQKYAVQEKKRIEQAKKAAEEEEEKEEEEAVTEAEEEEAEEEAAEEETAEEEAEEEAAEEEAVAEEEAEEQESEETAEAEEAPEEEPAEVEEQEAEEVAEVEEQESEEVAAVEESEPTEMAVEEEAPPVEAAAVEEAPVEAAPVEAAVVETEAPEGDFGLMDFTAAEETPVVAVEMESFEVEEFSFTDIPVFEAVEVETPQETATAVEETQEASSAAIEAETLEAAVAELEQIQDTATEGLLLIAALEEKGVNFEIGSFDDLEKLVGDFRKLDEGTNTITGSAGIRGNELLPPELINELIEQLGDSGDIEPVPVVTTTETIVTNETVPVDETEFTGRRVGQEFDGSTHTSSAADVFAKGRSSDQSLLTAFTNTPFVNSFNSAKTIEVVTTTEGQVSSEAQTVLSETLTRISDNSEGVTHSDDVYVLPAPIPTGSFYSQVQEDTITLGDSTFRRIYDNIAEFVLMEKENEILPSEEFLYFGKESGGATKQGVHFYSTDVSDLQNTSPAGAFVHDEVGSLLTVNGQKLQNSGGAGFIVDYDKGLVFGAAFAHHGLAEFEGDNVSTTSTAPLVDPLTGLSLSNHVTLPVNIHDDNVPQTIVLGDLNSDASISNLRLLNNMGFINDPNATSFSGSSSPSIFNNTVLNTFSGEGHLYGSEEEGIGVSATDGGNGFFGAGGFLHLTTDIEPQVEGAYTGFVQGMQTGGNSGQVHVQGSIDLNPLFSTGTVTGVIDLDTENPNVFDLGGTQDAINANYVFSGLTSTSQNVFLTPETSFFTTLELPEFYDANTQQNVSPSGVMWGTWNVVKEEIDGDKIIFPGLHNFWTAAIKEPLVASNPLLYYTGANIRTAAGETEASPPNPSTDVGISEFAVNQDTEQMEGLIFFEQGDVMVYKGGHNGQDYSGNMTVISADGNHGAGGVYSSVLNYFGLLYGNFASTSGENLSYRFSRRVFDEGGDQDFQYGVGIASRTSEAAAITTESFIGHMEGVTIDGAGVAAPIEGGVIGAEMNLSVFPSPSETTGLHNSAFQVDIFDNSNALYSTYGTSSSSIDTYINKDAFIMQASNSFTSFGPGFTNDTLDGSNSYIMSTPGLNDFQYSSWGRWNASAINHNNRAVGYFGIANNSSEFIPSISTISISAAPTYHYTGVSVGTVFDNSNPFGYTRTGSVILDVNFDEGQSFGLITYDDLLKVTLEGYLSGATILNGVRHENSFTIDIAGPQAEEVVGSFSASDNTTAIIGALGAKSGGSFPLERFIGHADGVAITPAGAASLLSGVDLKVDIKGSALRVFGGIEAFDTTQAIYTDFTTVGAANVYSGKDSLFSGIQTAPQQNTSLGSSFVSQLTDPSTLRPLLDPTTSTLSSMSGLEAYNHISWGVWHIDGLSDAATGYYAIGSDDTIDLPNVTQLISGGDTSYDYSGAARGTVFDSANPGGIVEEGSAILTVDFSTGNVLGNILLGLSRQITLLNGVFTSINPVAEQGSFIGDTLFNTVTTTQGFKGKVYGPLAEESAGTFRAADELTTIIGAFGMNKTGVTVIPPDSYKGHMEGYVLDANGNFVDIGFTVGTNFLVQDGVFTGAVNTNDPVSGDIGQLIVLGNANNIFTDKNSFFANLQENPDPIFPVGSFANFGPSLVPSTFDPTTTFIQAEPGLEAFQNIGWASLQAVRDSDGTKALGYIGFGRDEAQFMPDISGITATTNTVYKYGGASTATVFDSANPLGAVETGTATLAVDFASGNIFGDILLGASRMIYLVDGFSLTSDPFGEYVGETVYNGVKGGGFAGTFHGSQAEETVGSFAASDPNSTVIGAFGASNNVITYEPFNQFGSDIVGMILDPDEFTHLTGDVKMELNMIGTGGTEAVFSTLTVTDNVLGNTNTLHSMSGYNNYHTNGENFHTQLQDFGNPVSFGPDFPLQNIDFNNSYLHTQQGYGLGVSNFGRYEIQGTSGKKVTGYFGYGNTYPTYLPVLPALGNTLITYSGAAAGTVYDTTAFYHVLDFGGTANLSVDLADGNVYGSATIDFKTINFINGRLTGEKFVGDTELFGNQVDGGLAGRLYGANAEETAGSFVAKRSDTPMTIVGAFGLSQQSLLALEVFETAQVLEVLTLGDVTTQISMVGSPGSETLSSLLVTDNVNNNVYELHSIIDGPGPNSNYFNSKDSFSTPLRHSNVSDVASFGHGFVPPEAIDPNQSTYASRPGLEGFSNIGWGRFDVRALSGSGNHGWGYAGFRRAETQYLPDLSAINANGNQYFTYSGNSIATYTNAANPGGIESTGSASLNVNFYSGEVDGAVSITGIDPVNLSGAVEGDKIKGSTTLNGVTDPAGFEGLLAGTYAEEAVGSFVARDPATFVHGAFGVGKTSEIVAPINYAGEIKGVILDEGAGLLIEDSLSITANLSGNPSSNSLVAVQDIGTEQLLSLSDANNSFISKDDFFSSFETSPTGGQLSMGANFPSQTIITTNTFIQDVPGLENFNYIGWGSWAVEGSINQARGYIGLTQSGPNFAPDIQAIINTGVTNYTYSGVSVGSIFDSANPSGVLHNGTTSLNVDFSNGTVVGNTTLGPLNIGFQNGVINGAGFKGDTLLNQTNTTGGFVGRFAGPMAEEAAGSFHARDGPTTTAVGAFGVSRPP